MRRIGSLRTLVFMFRNNSPSHSQDTIIHTQGVFGVSSQRTTYIIIKINSRINIDQFSELFLQRAPIIYPLCLYTNGHKISHTHQMSRIK